MRIGDKDCTTMWYAIQHGGKTKHKFWYNYSVEEACWDSLCGKHVTYEQMGRGTIRTKLPCQDCQNYITMVELAQ